MVKKHKEAAVHPPPLQLVVHHYESYVHTGQIYGLPADFRYVGTDDDHKYVIGVILGPHLFPLMAPRAGSQYTFERVKVRIHGDIANESVPILKDDPLNNRFFQKFKSLNIRSAQIE